MNILQKIIAGTKERVEARKKFQPLAAVKAQALQLAEGSRRAGGFSFPFEAALRSEDIALICEIKKASPSKGVISEDFPYLDIAKDYELAGADAISVLTEPDFFKGDSRYLREIADAVSVPLLRKDFIIDSYMIYEAKILGAGAVLLICSVLNRETLAGYISLAHSLGMSALVETRDEPEVEKALSTGAKIIGVNNRDLKTFEVDMTVSERLRKLVPPEVLFVSESGIKTPEDIDRLRVMGVNAALIGETIMRSPDKKAEIEKLRGTAKKGGHAF